MRVRLMPRRRCSRRLNERMLHWRPLMLHRRLRGARPLPEMRSALRRRPALMLPDVQLLRRWLRPAMRAHPLCTCVGVGRAALAHTAAAAKFVHALR